MMMSSDHPSLTAGNRSTIIGNGSSSNGVLSSSRQRQQQQQKQQQQSSIGNHSVVTSGSTRFGNDYPYRDDPTAPPSVRLESFTPGGYGPLHSRPDNNNTYNHYYDNDTKKETHAALSGIHKLHSLSQQCYRSCCRICCARPGTSETNTNGVTTTTTTATPLSLHQQQQQEQQRQLFYYQDDFNDLSYSCSIGTSDDDGIWLNRNDPAGTIMSCLVWVLIGYSAITMTFLAQTGGISPYASYLYTILASLALATHVKTTLTDPGSVPPSAVPTEEHRYGSTTNNNRLSMCSQCQTYKPPGSHHCRICNRCISRMDHHCPWMNNCIGAGNLKHFLLFLIYTWICSVLSLLYMGYNYFFCADESCAFNIVLTQLVRLMTILSIGAFLFTSSMLMNVVYGIMTGIGTIDRLKKKASGSMGDSDEESIPLKNIFGIGPYWEWFIPLDPLFEDYDIVMGYATPQRYLREQMRAAGGVVASGGVVSPSLLVPPSLPPIGGADGSIAGTTTVDEEYSYNGPSIATPTYPTNLVVLQKHHQQQQQQRKGPTPRYHGADSYSYGTST